MKRILRLGIALAGLAGLAVASASAQEVRYNTFMPPLAIESVQAQEFFKELSAATNNKLTGRVFVGGQMLGGQATLGGIRDGVVDVGFIVPTLNSSEIPHVAMLPELLPFADDFWAASGATNATTMLDCKECIKDLDKHNAVWLGGHAASPWYLMCARPMSQFSDLAGRKVRVTGGFATRMIKALGGVSVAMAASEVAPALQQGQIDCAVGNLAWLTTLGLIDSVKGIVDQPFGSYHGLGEFIFNKHSLARLDTAERQALMKLIPRRIALITKSYEEEQAAARTKAEKRGITFWKPDAAFQQAMEKFRAGEREAVAKDIVSLGGSADAKKIVEAHINMLEKWRGLVTPVRGDPEAFAALLQKEVFSKVQF
jgi:TRAP-type C4-dicarboxylate transport system substrate-binding protein